MITSAIDLREELERPGVLNVSAPELVVYISVLRGMSAKGYGPIKALNHNSIPLDDPNPIYIVTFHVL